MRVAVSHLAVVRNPSGEGGGGSLSLDHLGGGHGSHRRESRRLLARHSVPVDVVQGLGPPGNGRLEMHAEKKRGASPADGGERLGKK